MATTALWSEFNGSSPTETTNVTNCNWTSHDAVDTGGAQLYSSWPITAGQASFHKCQALRFTNAGTSATISSLSYLISANNTSGSPWIVKGAVSSGTGYTTPTATALTTVPGGASMVTFPSSGTPLAGTFGTNVNTAWGGTTTTGPFSAAGSTSIAVPTSQVVYATALWTQLIVASNAGAGQIAPGGTAGSVTITATWTEA